jgi:hypothetical protein
MTEKHEQNHEDQDHAADQNIGDRFNRGMDQGRPVVEGLDLHPFRQFPLVQFLDLFPDPLQYGQRLVSALQEDHPFHDVVVVVDADLAQPHPMPHRHGSQRLDENGGAFLFGHHHIFDIRQTVDQPEAANVVVLGADGEVVAADVGVAVGQGLHDLREADLITDQLPGIDIDVIFLGRASEGRHIDDPRHTPELSPDLPILDRLEVGQTRLPVSGQFIAVDLCNRPPGRQGRLHVLRKTDRGQAIDDFLPVEEVLRPEVEIDLHVAQPENR